MSEIKLVAAGKFTSRDKWIHPDVTVPTTEFIIVTEGYVNIEENGDRYTLSAGDVLMLEPGVRHRGFAESKTKTSFYWIHISDFDADSDTAPEKYFHLSEPCQISVLCLQLLHYSGLKRRSDAVGHLLAVLLYELYAQSRASVDDDNTKAYQIVEWIRINSDRNITARDVARQFGYNEDYISRLLKKQFGSGLKTQISEQKLKLIGNLLLETDLSLSAIADAAGFSDYKLFLKFFKYHSGMTPNEFRCVYYAVHTNNR